MTPRRRRRATADPFRGARRGGLPRARRVVGADPRAGRVRSGRSRSGDGDGDGNGPGGACTGGARCAAAVSTRRATRGDARRVSEPRDAPVDRYALPRHRWWPVPAGARPARVTRVSRRRRARLREHASPAGSAGGVHRGDSVPRGRVPSARERAGTRSARDSRRANATFEFSNRIDEKTNRKAPEWTAAGRASKRSAGIGRGGAFGAVDAPGKKVLGKSFYDASVRVPPGDDAYHRSRLANHRSVLAGGSRRAGSDDGSDHRPAADADDDARSLSSLASAKRTSSKRATMTEIRAREIRRPREIRLPLRCSQVFPGCPRRSRGAPAWTRSARSGGRDLV